ncbi:hypothetical protein PYW07_009095 [Mythimna separata]|uniref:Endonuclease/exonuclease/phosphatase domain-containing protein n=1 Tax=Mythimna separata TaxID=271217 RepID=A0AAD8DM95_MYTSE|nr:hypothetical protein PYW07_009095 [Mythimna separata]
MASANRTTPAPGRPRPRVWETVGVASDDIEGKSIHFKLMSYNILAQSLLESNSYLFKHNPPPHQDWQYRFDVLFKQIFDQYPDILCLQEVERKYLRIINERLENGGYYGKYKKKTGVSQIDGCAIYVKRSVFEIQEVTSVEFFQPELSMMLHHHVGLIVKVKPRSMSRCMVIANTHLLCQPKKAIIRLAQLRLFLAEIDRVAYEFNGRNSGHLPIILTGDLNSYSDSDIIKLLDEGQIRKWAEWIDKEWKDIGITDNCQHLAVYMNRMHGWPTDVDELDLQHSEYLKPSDMLRREMCSAANKLHKAMYSDMFTSDVLSHSLHLQSVYATSGRNHNSLFFRECCHDVENCICIPRARVDYIYFNFRSGLRPLQRLRLGKYDKLPNECNGSDHQPLVAIFELNAETPY